MNCNIMHFDFEKVRNEVRYGGKSANALQRGFWTHTQKGASYLNSLTNGWAGYSHSMALVKMLSLALNSTPECRGESCKILQNGIGILKDML